jgi:hypothetical protein
MYVVCTKPLSIFQITQIQPQKSYVVGMGNQKYRQISQILKEHEENKKRILATLAKRQEQGDLYRVVDTLDDCFQHM